MSDPTLPPSKQKLRQEVLDCVPSTWLDQLLSGPGAVIKNLPANGTQIEALLRAVRGRIRIVFENHGIKEKE